MGYGDDFQKIVRSEHLGEFGDVSVGARMAPGKDIHCDKADGCWALRGEEDLYTGVTLTLRELQETIKETPLCARCGWLFLGGYNGALRDKHPQLILTFEEHKTRLKSFSKMGASTSASAVQKRLEEIPGILTTLAAAQKSAGDYPLLQKALGDLLSGFESAKDLLAGYATSDDARAKLEKKVKAAMVPKRFQKQNIDQDQNLHLIGISPMPTHHNQVAAVIDAYGIRRDNVAVLVAPAYMYAYLLQQLYPKPTSTYLVVSTPAPQDKVLQELIAGIWDPEGEGALACMHAAMDAARSLQGE